MSDIGEGIERLSLGVRMVDRQWLESESSKPLSSDCDHFHSLFACNVLAYWLTASPSIDRKNILKSLPFSSFLLMFILIKNLDRVTQFHLDLEYQQCRNLLFCLLKLDPTYRGIDQRKCIGKSCTRLHVLWNISFCAFSVTNVVSNLVFINITTELATENGVDLFWDHKKSLIISDLFHPRYFKTKTQSHREE